MDDEEREQDWVRTEGLFPEARRYVRTQFVQAELRDFGRDVGITIDAENGKFHFVLSREEMQKLFDYLWTWHYRPKQSI